MTDSTKNSWQYLTQVQMNKPMKFMGLSSMQLFISIGILGFIIVISTTIFHLSPLVPFLIDGVIFIPIFFGSKKLAAEHKKGNSTYLGSYFAFMNTPKKIIDKNKIFSFIVNE